MTASQGSPDVVVRPAGPADAGSISALIELAYQHVSVVRGGASLLAERGFGRGGGDDAPADDVAQGECLVLVAEFDGAVIGMASVRSVDRPPIGRAAVVEALFVDPDGREIGAGEALLVEVIAWAVSRGCVEIDADALPGDRATKNFFESAGLVARKIVVSRRLDSRLPAPDSEDP